MKKSLIYKKRISSVFLCAYLFFVVFSAIHFHTYSLFNDPSFKNYSKSNYSTDHFLSNSYSFCTVSHFSNSILDLKFSSNNFSPFLNEREELKLVANDKFTSQLFVSKNSSRAPPAFS